MPRMPRLSFDTGLTEADAENDVLRARRERKLAVSAHRLRREPRDFDVILPFHEVVEALGRVSERHVGVRSIPLADVVGTVDRAKGFDRSFRPTSNELRARWERIARAMRRGESIPPIDVYRVGGLFFVEDGHHRVSVARAIGLTHIDADVTEVRTKVDTDPNLRVGDLPLKSHRRLFFERVPLPEAARAEIQLSDPNWYDALAEGVEAWGFRAGQERHDYMTREEVALAWLEHEYRPVVQMLREAGLLEDETPAEGYARVAAERYRLLRTHSWSPEVVERLRDELG